MSLRVSDVSLVTVWTLFSKTYGRLSTAACLQTRSRPPRAAISFNLQSPDSSSEQYLIIYRLSLLV